MVNWAFPNGVNCDCCGAAPNGVEKRDPPKPEAKEGVDGVPKAGVEEGVPKAAGVEAGVPKRGVEDGVPNADEEA